MVDMVKLSASGEPADPEKDNPGKPELKSSDPEGQGLAGKPTHPIEDGPEAPTSEDSYPESISIPARSGMAFQRRLDEEWTLEFVSPGCYPLTGYHSEELIKNHVISYGQLVHPEDRASVEESLSIALAASKPYDLVYRIVTASGSEKWVRELGRGNFISGGDIPMLEGYITDITEQKQPQPSRRRQMKRSDALRQMDKAFSNSLDLRSTLELLLDQVIGQLNADAADIFLFNPVTQSLEYALARGFRTNLPARTRLRLGESFAGIAALERHPIHISDLADPDSAGLSDFLASEEGFVTYFAEPLVAKGQVEGVLELYFRRKFEPDLDWVEFLTALAGQAAIAISNSTLFTNLQRSNIELSLAYDSALEGWSKAIELRDKDLEGHILRVTELTLSMARALKVSARDLVHIRRGAILHDIGKMCIPDHILLKSEPLTNEEWAIIRAHPTVTYELFSPIPYLRPAMTIPYCHHERWDGSGYPRGLRGEQIPLEARIFAVADVYDSLITNRPYRQAWPKKQALAYIREQSGKHFDPKVVEVFLNLVDQAAAESE
jgi:PAS domain S-box-containing protein/putative nucleotidyltransferase with HDIG domain